MMMHVLPSNDGRHGMALLLLHRPRILELGRLLLQSRSHGIRVAVLMMTLFDAHHVVGMLFRQYFAVSNGLHRGVVVVLVHFAVNGRLGFFVTFLHDVLVDYCRSDLFVDGGIMMACFGPVRS